MIIVLLAVDEHWGTFIDMFKENNTLHENNTKEFEI